MGPMLINVVFVYKIYIQMKFELKSSFIFFLQIFANILQKTKNFANITKNFANYKS
jgi:hypothetical protein